jgi:hypothetical protein
LTAQAELWAHHEVIEGKELVAGFEAIDHGVSGERRGSGVLLRAQVVERGDAAVESGDRDSTTDADARAERSTFWISSAASKVVELRPGSDAKAAFEPDGGSLAARGCRREEHATENAESE